MRNALLHIGAFFLLLGMTSEERAQFTGAARKLTDLVKSDPKSVKRFIGAA
jgi:hypothetical protein